MSSNQNNSSQSQGLDDEVDGGQADAGQTGRGPGEGQRNTQQVGDEDPSGELSGLAGAASGGGMDEEVGDLDDALDDEEGDEDDLDEDDLDEEQDDDGSLPGRMGGGLAGG